MQIGFDNEKYIKMQSERIKERIAQFGNKLYLEFGGKLFDDYHASRVLPGFVPDTKIKMLSELATETEIIIVISSENIEKNKIRADIGISYEADVFRLIDAFRSFGLEVSGVVITRYKIQKNTENFKKKLENFGIKYYLHYEIEGYPSDIKKIVSKDGYGKNDYIETKKPLVVVTAPGPGSGKMATCLSQLFHEYQQGKKAGYAKFETFPIWNLPLKHPVNLAYEAATADLNDVNMIDPFHLEAYGETTINYNRDIEIFPILEAIFEKIQGNCPYKSPTYMGVNMAGFCIFDDKIVEKYARNEIIRRYFSAKCDQFLKNADESIAKKIELVIKKANIEISERKVIEIANQKAEEKNTTVTAIELDNGEIITGKSSSLMTSGAAAIINVLKKLGNIDDTIPIISSIIFETIQKLKSLKDKDFSKELNINDVLIAISISATTSPVAEIALKQLENIRGLDAHSSEILPQEDITYCKRLGISLSMEAKLKEGKYF